MEDHHLGTLAVTCLDPRPVGVLFHGSLAMAVVIGPCRERASYRGKNPGRPWHHASRGLYLSRGSCRLGRYCLGGL